MGLMPLRDSFEKKCKCRFKIIQYMALGIPAVASAVGGQCRYRAPRHRRIQLRTIHREDWRRSLVLLLHGAQMRSEMGKSARACVEQFYSTDRQVGRFVAIFRKVLASSSSSMIVSMTPRTRSRTASSTGSNQSSKSIVPDATAAVFVVFFVMAWSPFRRSNAGISWVSTPETTPTEFQPLPRRDPTVGVPWLSSSSGLLMPAVDLR